jgi:hypothetical protein
MVVGINAHISGSGHVVDRRQKSNLAVKLNLSLSKQLTIKRPANKSADIRPVAVAPSLLTGKQKRYPALTLTKIHAQERGTLKNRKKIDWKLITDLPGSVP